MNEFDVRRSDPEEGVPRKGNGGRPLHRSARMPERPSHAPSQTLISVGAVLKVVRRWWKIGIPVGVVLAAISVIFVYRGFVPVYRATAWLRIENQAPYVAFETRGRSDEFVRTQLQLIRSPMVLERAVGKPEIAAFPEIKESPDPIGWLSSRVSVNSVGNSELYHVAFTGPDPGHAAQIANCVAEAYFQVYTQDDAERSQRVIELLEQEKRRRAEEVRMKQESLRELTKQLTGRDPIAGALQPLAIEQPLAKLQGHIVDSQVEGEMLKAELQAVEELAAQDQIEVPPGMVDRQLADHPLYAELAEQREKLSETELHARQGKQSPVYLQLEAGVKQLEAKAEKVRTELLAQLKAQMLAKRDEKLDEMRRRLEGHQLSEKVLRERYEEQLKLLKKDNGQSLELEFSRSELDREETVYTKLADRAFQMRTELRAPGRITFMRRADVPSAPVEAMPFKWILMAMLGSLCVPFGLAFAWEQVFHRIGDVQELKQHSDLPVVGEISMLPPIRGLMSSRRLGMSRNASLFRESIDSLRTGLILSESFGHLHVLAVTSAMTGEGKSSVASQLAVSIARSTRERTLLIDADMRRPDIQNIFELPLSPGLVDVLNKTRTLDEAVVRKWSDNLDILTAGSLQTNPHDLVGHGAFKAVVEEARESYHYIVIDTPPILSASESLVFASEADAALICTMRDVTRVDQVRVAYERLIGVGARPIGTVLNGVPTTRYSYYYGYYGYASETSGPGTEDRA
jgi:polysaccharide biosynthesis transport protein